MSIIYRLLICAVVASPASSLYYGWITNGSVSYVFNTTAALSFTAVAILCVLLTHINFANINNSTDKPTNKPTKRSGKGRQQGEVKWFNGGKGFGFITCDDNSEIFVHFRSVQKGSQRLSPGKRVEFNIVNGKKGEEAEDVVVI